MADPINRRSRDKKCIVETVAQSFSRVEELIFPYAKEGFSVQTINASSKVARRFVGWFLCWT
jgi:hypothetical protein